MTPQRTPAVRLAPLFLVSAATVGFEIALTRYFAVAKWSEYGYWVISIVLAGFALSGVTIALARDWFARHGALLLSWLPPALLVAGAAGYHLATENPFNPLQLQNQATLWPQLGLIGVYYADLLPFFFLAGLFVSLSFVLGADRVGRVYGFDLTGAGAGALLALGLMWVVHPFRLVACLLLPLAAAAPFATRRRLAVVAATALALAGGEALLLLFDAASFNDFKAIYAPLHVPDSRTLATILSPRGLYMLLDDFTERVDTDVSNDAGQLGLPGPPTTFGLYRDGNRIASLPKPAGLDVAYAGATLAALPYALLKNPRALLIGASGGFRPPRHWRSVSRARTYPSRSRCSWGRSVTGSMVLLPGRKSPMRACSGLDRWHWHETPQGCSATTSWTYPAIFSTRPRPMPRRSPPRLWRPTCAPSRQRASCRYPSPSASFPPMPAACWRPCARPCWRPESPPRRST